MRAVLVSTSLILALGAAIPALAQITGPVPHADAPERADEPQRPPEPKRPQARQQPGGTPLKSPEEAGAKARRLDALFTDLKHEASAAKAEAIAARIGAEWLQSGSATVDLLVQRATLAIAKDDKAAAYDFLDQAIILDPNYPEAWNRRATLSYTADDYGKSLDDIRATLRLEPRHYGALMGLAAILEETDRKPQALEAYAKVLEIYPALKAAQDAVLRLSDELAGQAL